MEVALLIEKMGILLRDIMPVNSVDNTKPWLPPCCLDMQDRMKSTLAFLCQAPAHLSRRKSPNNGKISSIAEAADKVFLQLGEPVATVE